MEKEIYDGIFRDSISILRDARNIYHTIEPDLTAEGCEIDIFYARNGAVLIRSKYYDPLKTVSPADPPALTPEQLGCKMKLVLFHPDSSKFGEIERRVLEELSGESRHI